MTEVFETVSIYVEDSDNDSEMSAATVHNHENNDENEIVTINLTEEANESDNESMAESVFHVEYEVEDDPRTSETPDIPGLSPQNQPRVTMNPKILPPYKLDIKLEQFKLLCQICAVELPEFQRLYCPAGCRARQVICIECAVHQKNHGIDECSICKQKISKYANVFVTRATPEFNVNCPAGCGHLRDENHNIFFCENVAASVRGCIFRNNRYFSSDVMNKVLTLLVKSYNREMSDETVANMITYSRNCIFQEFCPGKFENCGPSCRKTTDHIKNGLTARFVSGMTADMLLEFVKSETSEMQFTKLNMFLNLRQMANEICQGI